MGLIFPALVLTLPAEASNKEIVAARYPMVSFCDCGIINADSAVVPGLVDSPIA
jgi:hypothetical protein